MKSFRILIIVLLPLNIFISCKTNTKIINGPFELSQYKNNYSARVDCNSIEYIKGYHYKLFSKYKLSGNGYSWDGVVKQILMKKNPALLTQIEFNSEAGMSCVESDKKSIIKFINTLNPIFNNRQILEDYLSKIDLSKIDD